MENPSKMDDLGGNNHHFRNPPTVPGTTWSSFCWGIFVDLGSFSRWKMSRFLLGSSVELPPPQKSNISIYHNYHIVFLALFSFLWVQKVCFSQKSISKRNNIKNQNQTQDPPPRFCSKTFLTCSSTAWSQTIGTPTTARNE